MADKIEKIAENNVEFTPTIKRKDKNGLEYEEWGDTESYGQDDLTRLIALAVQVLTDAEGFNERAYKTQQIAIAQAQVDKLKAIQIEMDK